MVTKAVRIQLAFTITILTDKVYILFKYLKIFPSLHGWHCQHYKIVGVCVCMCIVAVWTNIINTEILAPRLH